MFQELNEKIRENILYEKLKKVVLERSVDLTPKLNHLLVEYWGFLV